MSDKIFKKLKFRGKHNNLLEYFKEDGKEYVSFKHRDKFSKKFIAHGSRPTYVKRALELYALEESDIQDYTAISWEKNKLR